MNKAIRSIIHYDTRWHEKLLSMITYLPLRIMRGILYEIAQRIEIDTSPLERLGMLIHRLNVVDRFMVLAKLPDGNKVMLKLADFTSFVGFADVLEDEIYERYYKIKRRDVIFDIGANVGVFTLKASKLVGHEGLVVAVEPDPFNFSTLLRNIRINALEERITSVDEAIGNVDGRIKFYANEYFRVGSSAYIKSKLSEPIEVKACKLDTLIKRLNITRINLLKCDAEGAEVDMIKGGSEALNRISNLAVAAYHVPLETRLALMDTLRHRGFKVILTKNGYLYATRL